MPIRERSATDRARAELILVQAPANRPVAIARPSQMRRFAGHLDGWRFNAGEISGMGETGEVGLGEDATLYDRTYGTRSRTGDASRSRPPGASPPTPGGARCAPG